MKLVGSSGQIVKHPMFDASGAITTGGTAQLILPELPQASMCVVQNISDTDMFLEIGSARATATITSGVVTSIAVANAGFGFTAPPRIFLLGGGDKTSNPNYLGAGQPGFESPKNVAKAVATVSGGAVTAITVMNGGANYINAPYVFIRNAENDPFGCAIPSATSGILLSAQGGSWFMNGTAQTTDAMAIFCATTGKRFTCKWMQ